MKRIYTLHRRTFEAANHPEGSPERAALNCDTLTSEYQRSYRYAVRTPAVMSDGTPNPAQRFHTTTFTTKREAQAAMNALALIG